MNISLVGTSAREAVALKMFIEKIFPGSFVHTPRLEKGEAWPDSDFFVIDLVGQRWFRWTDNVQDSLFKTLGSKPAVLLAPAYDQTWSELVTKLAKTKSVVVLVKPFSSEAMRGALKTVADAATNSVIDLRPVSKPVQQVTAIKTEPEPKSEPVPEPIKSVSVADFKNKVESRQETIGRDFLLRMAGKLNDGEAFEVRLNVLNRLIFIPSEQKVGHPPLSGMVEVLRNNKSADLLEFDLLVNDDAKARIQRLGLEMMNLDAFLWELDSRCLEKK